MKELEFAVKTRGWVFGMVAVAIILVCTCGIAWLLRQVTETDLHRFDWTAAEAVATFLAADMAGAAGLAAVYAARVALSVDSLGAVRTRERESRDAFPIASVIQHEGRIPREVRG